MAEKGEVAYNAWAKASNLLDSTHIVSPWNELGSSEQEVWVAVEDAVLDADDDEEGVEEAAQAGDQEDAEDEARAADEAA